MSKIRLIHVTAELPPTVGGVSDYAAILTRQLVKVADEAVEPVFLHAGREAAETIDTEFDVVDQSGQQSATALANSVQQLAEKVNIPAVVLLEYSGYGYARRGAPRWLLQGLRRVCQPLITIFHEINASGPVWSSAFWLAPVQQWIAKNFVQLSERVFVNRPGGAEQLRQWARGSSKVSFRPVFSNVGEPGARTPFDGRSNYAVVFCGQQEKDTLYAHPDRLNSVLEAGNVDRLVDIGPHPETTPDLGISHEVQGIQPVNRVSQWLSEARLGLAHRRLDLLTKSGVVAAYLAHGVPPVILPNGSAEHAPALTQGKHFTTMERAVAESVDWEKMSREGYAWYQDHAHSTVTAQQVWERIQACAVESEQP